MSGATSMDGLEQVALALRKAKRVLAITGAGISAESGLPTYRGVGGLYAGGATEEGVPIEVALSGPVFRKTPALTWKYLLELERACRGATFNPAHQVLAKWESRFEGFWVLTQNVDGFHVAAGSRQVIAIHGDLHRIACTRCDARRRVQTYEGLGLPPACAACGAVERPEVVLFEEMLPPAELQALREVLARPLDVVLSIGTTSVFPYIAEPVYAARRHGGLAVEINPGDTEVSEVVQVRLRTGAVEALGKLDALL